MQRLRLSGLSRKGPADGKHQTCGRLPMGPSCADYSKKCSQSTILMIRSFILSYEEEDSLHRMRNAIGYDGF